MFSKLVNRCSNTFDQIAYCIHYGPYNCTQSNKIFDKLQSLFLENVKTFLKARYATFNSLKTLFNSKKYT